MLAMAKNPKKTMIYSEVYTVDEFAKIFKLSRDVVLTLIRKGEIPAISFGNQQRIPRAIVDHYLAQATTPNQRGFGMWSKKPISAVAYVNKLRDREQRSPEKFLKDIAEDE
jgi:excisionase family DNA binding protein